MGKTADGAVWLNADMLSPYDYWQFWRNTDDGDVGTLLRRFTELSLADIEKLEALEGAKLNDAKKTLATEATAMAHGRVEADKAAETARVAFEQGAISADLPTVEIAASSLEAGLGVLTAFVTAGLCASNGEARRQIKGGGARVNGKPVQDERGSLSRDDLTETGVIKLSLGKKKHVLLKPV